MFVLKPYIPTAQEKHEHDLWTRAECYRYYVEQRRANCTPKELLDLWLLAPYCETCALVDPLRENGLPDIAPDEWEMDMLIHLGPKHLGQVKETLSGNPEYAYLCKKCGRELQPWQEDSVYIVSYHLEDHYGIPLTTPGKVNPSRKIQNQIISLYEDRCFGCGKRGRSALHIDHVRPRAKDGDAAFRNLQPLCEICGNEKGDQDATEVEVYSLMYFGPYPSDSYAGLFW